MSTFRVTFTQTVNASIDVEADTPTQAMASAEESLYVSLRWDSAPDTFTTRRQR